MIQKELEAGAQLGQYFTPSKPVTLPDLLEGRFELLMRLSDDVATPSQHVLLYGDRGVGKTSIARVLEALLRVRSHDDSVVKSVMTSCDSNDTFEKMWNKVFRTFSVVAPQTGLGRQGQVKPVSRMDLEGPLSSPDDIRLMINRLPNETVFIFDEYDRVREEETRRLMTDTIKLFSDSDSPCTIVLVGVAQSIEELVSAHESISRNLDFVSVDPMAPSELAKIISNGFEKAGLKMQSGLDRRIAKLSQGYPHYTHLLGLWAGRGAVARNSNRVEIEDLRVAINDSLKRVDGSIRIQYQKATDSTQPNNLYKQVLLACAMANKDVRGRFTFSSLRQPLLSLLNKGEKPVGYQRHLAAFCEDERGPALIRTGRSKNYRWHFADPQLIPFVYLQGISDNLMSEDDVGP